VPCLLLNVVQSALLNAPRFVALAVGTFKVITGVVVLFATVLVKSVPVVPNVNAATDVTVPPPPPPAYCGIFKTFPIKVAAPLVPVVVNDVIRFVYAVSQLVCEAVVGIEYPLVRVIANVPLAVIGEPLMLNPVGTDNATDVTLPTVHVLFAARSNVVPLIVIVLPLGTASFIIRKIPSCP